MNRFRKYLIASSQMPQAGQAMVEFVIMLIIFMALCTGMIASMRLLTFQFWAQQEARFLAFEQTWVPHEFYSDPVNDPLDELNDGARFGRPDVVSDRQNERTVNDDGNLNQLLAFLSSRKVAVDENKKPLQQLKGEEAPVMLALNERPWWMARSDEWLRKKFESTSFFVNAALASQDVFSASSQRATSPAPDQDDIEQQSGQTDYQERLSRGISKLLHRQGFGPKICEALPQIAARHELPGAFDSLTGSGCSQRFENGFASHLAYNIDIPGFFQTYESIMQSGFSAPDALETAVRQEVASGFYSFFDGLVSTARSLAPVQIVSDRIDTSSTFTNSRFTSLISEATYVGSNAALGAIAGAAFALGFQNPNSRDAQAALQAEREINEFLHVDVEALYPLQVNHSPLQVLEFVAPGLQSGVMKNVLSQSEDADLRDPLVENSNKMVEVTYQSQGGLFPMATANIAGAEQARLTARFYLVTQPWHITRRNGTGAYREKGTQEDDVDLETEEALLRRRVKGLWLFPSDLGVLADPIGDIPFLSFLEPVFAVAGPVFSGLGVVKDFVSDNPLFDFAEALADLPLLGGFIPTVPENPAVRPDAYPGSTELSGSDSDDPDKMAGSDREFEDYLEEQRDFNPEPEPDYN